MTEMGTIMKNRLWWQHLKADAVGAETSATRRQTVLKRKGTKSRRSGSVVNAITVGRKGTKRLIVGN